MKVALAQINPCIGAFERNTAKIKEYAVKAADRGCDLVIFPELAVCGYPPGDLLERREFTSQALNAINELVEEIDSIAVLCGNITRNNGPTGYPLRNSAILFENGSIINTVHKRLLPTYDVFDETRYFEPGQKSLPFAFRDLNIGVTVCEDIWNDPEISSEDRYGVNPVKEICSRQCDLMLTISASPYRKGRLAERISILSTLAQKYNIPFVYSNITGGQDSLVFDGGSMAVTPDGKVAALASDFMEDMVIFDTKNLKGERHSVSDCVEEEVLKALSLALTDYLKRCGVSRVTLGLSGGIDSALTAAIAADALGPENVLGVLMPSEYTSAESILDAEELAANLGIKTLSIPVTPLFNRYRETMSPLFADMPEDVTEENMQARIRGNILMAISNKFGHMVLSTGNKSEAATGYCTLYGDMSGGYALISDVPKTMVYALSEYLNRKQEVIPERIIRRPPSAELRPDQKDQDELPEYDIVDAVIEMFMERGMTPEEIAGSGIEINDARFIIKKIQMNEYKRRQAAIGPRVTSRAFVRGWRYPVAHCFDMTGGNR